jgi:hypothetical protein
VPPVVEGGEIIPSVFPPDFISFASFLRDFAVGQVCEPIPQFDKGTLRLGNCGRWGMPRPGPIVITISLGWYVNPANETVSPTVRLKLVPV